MKKKNQELEPFGVWQMHNIAIVALFVCFFFANEFVNIDKIEKQKILKLDLLFTQLLPNIERNRKML